MHEARRAPPVVHELPDGGLLAVTLHGHDCPRIVLLVDVDGSPHACTPVHLHVAASRARHRLYVFARQGVELPG